MPENKDLKAFKVSDVRQGPAAAEKKQSLEQPENYSVGYEKIETILEREDPNEVLGGLKSSLEKLRKMENAAASPKEKALTKNAATAYEHTLELLEFLFKTKDALQQTLNEHTKEQ